MTVEAVSPARARTLPLRLAAWSIGPAAITGVHFAMLEVHPLARMWALAGVLFFWMKAVVLAERHHAGKPLPRAFVAWLLLWPGMRPVARAASPRLAVALQGLACIAIGTACMFTARLVWAETASLWATAPLIMVGFSLCLHFGLFNLLTAGWRMVGFSAGPLFRNPLASRSLEDFWSRRWNIAYVEMCQETVLRVFRNSDRQSAKTPKDNPRPLAFWRFGGKSQFATGAIFVFSGLLHEVAISLPVNADRKSVV